jgi:putative nucleotidyltransferase with HDIG domain
MEQRKKTLTVSLWLICATCLILGGVNLHLRAIGDAHVLFTAAAVCALGVWLNTRGHFMIAGILASLMMFLAADYNLYQAGGIHDPGVVAYPVIVFIGGLFFGRRSVPIFVLAALLSLSFIAWSEINRKIVTPYGADWDDLLTESVILVASGLVAVVVMSNHARNLDRIKRSEEEIRRAYDLTLEGLARVLEYHDKETEGHSRRVIELSVRLAQEMGLKDDELVNVRRGALLHDVGKLAVSDKILLKKGRLNPAERRSMEEHTLIAYQMLAPIEFLKPSLDIPRSHHERWDGGGYPDGLAGEAIPLIARIFAVVDQWDALSSARPYHPAWPKPMVLQHLRKNAGKIYDPRVVEAFLRLVA